MDRARWVFLFVLLLGVTGCGKYGPPIPPEALSPAGVENLTGLSDGGGVTLSWSAPTKDVRSKELKSIDGYKVLRSIGGSGEAALFEEAGFVADTHLVVQDELRAAARKEGRAAQRIKADPALSRFSFRDTAVTAGQSYTYKVVPVNQGGAEGRVSESLTVAYNGAESRVSQRSISKLDDSLLDEPLSADLGDL